MKFRIPFAALLCMALFAALGGCKKTDCTTVLCNPCQSSRFLIHYQDSLGACDSLVNANARVYAYDKNDTTFTTPAFDYALNSNCTASLLIEENYIYRITCSNPAFTDVIRPMSITYQSPVSITECCLCYPVNLLKVKINGVEQSVTFPAGQFENAAWARILP